MTQAIVSYDGTRNDRIATALRAGFTAFARIRGWRAR
jgi:hypothetical protein